MDIKATNVIINCATKSVFLSDEIINTDENVIQQMEPYNMIDLIEYTTDLDARVAQLEINAAKEVTQV
ncbi:MAG: hypothetical protein U0M23_06525 [Acutalibacteraceae bacterium]|nr:hypothetical protein [Acutalibacteraceae bacterium]